MLKTFPLQLPLDLDGSFELVRRSAREIVSWSEHRASRDNQVLQWKQSFWSLTGTSQISAAFEAAGERLTTVTVTVHKPFQVFDPVGICERVFRKLEKAVLRNLSRLEREGPNQAATRGLEREAH